MGYMINNKHYSVGYVCDPGGGHGEERPPFVECVKAFKSRLQDAGAEDLLSA